MDSDVEYDGAEPCSDLYTRTDISNRTRSATCSQRRHISALLMCFVQRRLKMRRAAACRRCRWTAGCPNATLLQKDFASVTDVSITWQSYGHDLCTQICFHFHHNYRKIGTSFKFISLSFINEFQKDLTSDMSVTSSYWMWRHIVDGKTETQITDVRLQWTFWLKGCPEVKLID